MTRKAIDLIGSTMDLLMLMSEGNPGAITVLTRMLQDSDSSLGVIRILDLDDMNIRGTQIWIGYKDYCKQDIDCFLKALQDRDPKMVQFINEQNKAQGETEIAVTSGSSF